MYIVHPNLPGITKTIPDSAFVGGYDQFGWIQTLTPPAGNTDVDRSPITRGEFAALLVSLGGGSAGTTSTVWADMHPVGSVGPFSAGGAPSPANMPLQGSKAIVLLEDVPDLRMERFGGVRGSELDANNTTIESWCVQVGVGGVKLPIAWGGTNRLRLDPGASRISDPLPIDAVAGTVLVVTGRVDTPFGGSGRTSTNATTIGATSTTLGSAPVGLKTIRGMLPQTIRIENEYLTLTDISDDGLTLTHAPTTANHASGVVVGQTGRLSGVAYSDVSGDGNEQNSAVDKTVAGSAAVTAVGGFNATTNAAAAIGDRKVTSAINPAGLGGTAVVVDGEAMTLKAIGGAGPYTLYFTGPFTAAHASGSAITGPGNTSIVMPTLLGSKPGGKAQLILSGDSIAQQVGDNVRGAQSFLSIAATNAGRTYTQLALAGERLTDFLATSGFSASVLGNRRRRQIYAAARGGWLIDEYGVNDIYNNRTLAQLQADKVTHWTQVRARGLRIAVTTLTPRTTSTDGFTTTVNQSVTGPSTYDLIRRQYNAWIRGGAGGLIDRIFDVADAVETSRDSGVWRVDGDGTPWTADGIHPSHVGHVAMAAVVDLSLIAA